MPMYEYECEKCGKVTELLRSMKDADEAAKCVHCGSAKIKRMHSVFSASAGGGKESALPVGCGRCNEPGRSCPFKA